MTDRLKSIREMLTTPERRPASPLYAFGASVALAISAVALAGMMILGPDRDRPRAVSEAEAIADLIPGPSDTSGEAGGFEISRIP
ncbi:hypothetical protein [Asticcacaulis tiandongensis]|uniref:hypothetical protein n=1 Tax=Asticcacaulis tiandongensis TaxID=2565365 RepID=UPI00112C2EE8|nr:hypothetical protein [Asticcacaulis tiandongensis]